MIDQIVIGVTGIISITITQLPYDKPKKYAPVIGLLSQPFWFYSSYTTELWGVFFLSFGYTAAWCLGFYNHWIRKNNKCTT